MPDLPAPDGAYSETSPSTVPATASAEVGNGVGAEAEAGGEGGEEYNKTLTGSLTTRVVKVIADGGDISGSSDLPSMETSGKFMDIILLAAPFALAVGYWQWREQRRT